MPTIERSNLDGSKRETIVSSNMNIPHDITVDQTTNKIYWADTGSGIYYRIESANLDGTNRKIILQDTHQTPYSIAVTKDMIFWTDPTSKSIWTLKKDIEGETPIKFRTFNESPKGIYAKNDIGNIIQCKSVLDAIEKSKNSVELFEIARDSIQCLNFGELVNNRCRCVRGFTGTRCETDLCHNYCVNGGCFISTEGYPQCKCPEGYSGSRCETEVCKGYCLNDGVCKPQVNDEISLAKCECSQGYSGERCENRNEIDSICTVICEEGKEFNIMDDGGKKCR